MSKLSEQIDCSELDSETLRLIEAHFDAAFYLDRYKDVARQGVDPFLHYVSHGSVELRDPNPEFSASFYAARYQDRLPEGVPPFVHYLRSGKAEGFSPNRDAAQEAERQLVRPFFDEAFYDGQNPDVAEAKQDALSHFMAYGCEEGRDPSATFSISWYRDQYMMDEPRSTNPMIHLLQRGMDIVYPAMPLLSEHQYQKISTAFDGKFYRKSYLSGQSSKIDPLQHFLTIGWILGYDPNQSFSTTFYAKVFRHDIKICSNPFVHYWTIGKKKGYLGHHQLAPGQDVPSVRALFDSHYYRGRYPDVKMMGVDPFRHYMMIGWKEGRDPSATFSSIFYARGYRDVAESGLHPLVHRALHRDGRKTASVRPNLQIAENIDNYPPASIAARQQDINFPLPLETAKRVAVILAPEHNEMSGGIFSIFSIANRMRRTKSMHGYDVVLMTQPNLANYTYCRQTNFRNQEDVFRFEQIIYCAEAEEIYLHIPEYAAAGFLSRCTGEVIRYLMSRKKLWINILNQNIELMPEAEEFEDLRRISNGITQSVAHHAYFSQQHADRYQLPTLLLPAYTDLSEYPSSKAADKENIIIYSFDDVWYKSDVLNNIRTMLPNYRLIEIRGITFDHYMDLATRCRFSISFGEGFDGYVAQPIYQGGIGFTVYRDEFFPSENFLTFPNFFRDPNSFMTGVVPLMRELSQDYTRHDALNARLVSEWDKLYSLEDYYEKIDKLSKRQFELFPEGTSR